MHPTHPSQYADALDKAAALVRGYGTLRRELTRIAPDIVNFDETLESVTQACDDEPEIGKLCPGLHGRLKTFFVSMIYYFNVIIGSASYSSAILSSASVAGAIGVVASD